jgi:hypothetical protein
VRRGWGSRDLVVFLKNVGNYWRNKIVEIKMDVINNIICVSLRFL